MQNESGNGSQSKEPEVKKRIGRGGPRPNSGRPKGKLEPRTVERKEALKRFRERVARSTDRLLNAQMSLVTGLSLLLRVDKDDKGHDLPAVQVTDPEEIRAYIDGEAGSEGYETIAPRIVSEIAPRHAAGTETEAA